MGPVRVFIACSLDGFIAGTDGDLSWLPQPPEGEDFGWQAFISSIGCLLMGRATYDTIADMDVAWPHPNRHTVVATHRPLDDAPPGVSAAAGPIDELISIAADHAGDRGIYVDGGDLIRQALDASRIDELVTTVCPVILGAGVPLFAGTRRRHELRLREHEVLPGGLLQLTYTVERPATGASSGAG